MLQSPVKITASLTAHPGRADELHELLSGMATHCRVEPGNLRWDVWRDSAMPERNVFDEFYRNAGAADAHRQTPRDHAYLARVPADRLALVLEAVALTE